MMPELKKYNVEMLEEGRLMILTPVDTEDHECSLIWLQGMGSTLGGVRDMFEDQAVLNLPENCRIVVPTAPLRNITEGVE
jgi:hypothetical protein